MCCSVVTPEIVVHDAYIGERSENNIWRAGCSRLEYVDISVSILTEYWNMFGCWKNSYFKTLKSDTHLPPVNRTLEIDHIEWWVEKINISRCSVHSRSPSIVWAKFSLQLPSSTVNTGSLALPRLECPGLCPIQKFFLDHDLCYFEFEDVTDVSVFPDVEVMTIWHYRNSIIIIIIIIL